MANMATGQPPFGVVQVSTTTPNPSLSPQPKNQSYKSILNPNSVTSENISIPAPSFDLHHGEPSFVWDDKVVDVMMRHEELHYAVIGKFSYGMPEFHALRKLIPLQCEIKGECSIGFLETRHVVIRLSLLEDYVHLLSRPAFSLTLGADFYSMRTMKYDVWFDPREETSIAIAWISFPGLPPAFFVKDAVFALASAVGKPLQLDAATKAKTRPICAKVKVEVDLLAARPQRLRIGIKNTSFGEIMFKWIRIRYDFMPKYCKECRLQGHNEEECFVLHPNIVPQAEVQAKGDRKSMKEPVKEDPLKVLQSGKIVGNVHKAGEVVPVQTLDRQNKYFKKFTNPNRNPNAWSRVENKRKQVQTDVARDQGEKVVTTNAFALLDNVDELQVEVDKTEQIQNKEVNLCQLAEVDGAKVRSHIVDTLVPGVENVSTQALPVAVSKGMEDLPKGENLSTPNHVGAKSWVRDVFKDHPRVDVVGISVKSGTGKNRADLNDAVSLSIEAGGQAARNDGLDLSFNATGAEGVVAGGLGVGGTLNIPVSSGINVAQEPSVCLNDAALILDNKDMQVVENEGLLNAEGELVPSAIKVPSALIVHGNCLNSNAGRESGVNTVGPVAFNATSGFNDSQLPSALLLDKMISPSLIINSSVESRGEEQPFPSVYGSPCEIKKMSDAFVVESRRVDDTSVLCGSTFITPAINIGVAQQPSVALNVVESRASHDSETPFVDMGEQLKELFSEDLEADDASTSPLGTNDAVGGFSGNEGINLSQGTCVENKQVLTVPSLEVSTSLESASVAKPKFFGKDLIPTVQLEQLCRSASPNFGKSFLNINAPSFVPKSLMQLVPHSKFLPTDDELVKRMDLNDTRGILARQVGSFQERVPQGHYLVEDDDLFEEEELEEESTAHNFSMVAREGDLSPREIHDNAPKRVRRVRRPLEPTRVQPTRSTKSKSKRSNKSKNSKK